MAGTTAPLLSEDQKEKRKCPDIALKSFVEVYDPSFLLQYRDITFRGVLPDGAVILEKKGRDSRLDLRSALIVESNRGWHLKEKGGGELIAI